MKIQFVRTSRIPRWPVWAVVLVALWSALQVATLILSAKLSREVVTCPLKRITGLPCPTCGATRGIISMRSAEILKGLGYNPLLFCVLGIALIALGVRIISARAVRVHPTPRQRRIAWAVALLLLLGNWVYVIYFVG